MLALNKPIAADLHSNCRRLLLFHAKVRQQKKKQNPKNDNFIVIISFNKVNNILIEPLSGRFGEQSIFFHLNVHQMDLN